MILEKERRLNGIPITVPDGNRSLPFESLREKWKSNIILEKFAASKQPFLITENAFKI